MDKKGQVNKILIVDNSVGITGALKSILNLAESMSGYQFIFAIPPRGNAEYVESRGFTSVEIPFVEVQKNWKLMIYLPMLVINAIKIKSICKRYEIDLIHVNDLYNLVGIVAKILNRNLNLVHHIRLLPTSYAGSLYSLWSKLVALYANAIICVSNEVARSLPETEKKVVIYDTAIGAYTQIINNHTLQLLYPANYIPGKGQEYALEAFAKARKHFLGMRLKFIGDDFNRKKNKSFLKMLKSKSKELGLDCSVSFEGYSANLGKDISEAEAVLMFSESESFSMICLEAGLIGRAVIATKSGGPEEIIENDITGMLVEKGNVDEMTEKIIFAANNRFRLKEMGENAAKDYSERFSIKNASKKLEKIYRSILLGEWTN